MPFLPWITGGLREVIVRCSVKLSGDRLQILLAIRPLHLPVAVPDSLQLQARACQSRARAIQPLGVIEVAAVQIAQREMRQVEIVHIPVACRLLLRDSRLGGRKSARSRIDARPRP